MWPRSRALWRAASARVRCRRAKREVGGCVGGGPDWLSAISAGPRRLGSIWTRSRLDLGYLSARISPSSRRACEAPAGDRGTAPAPEVARGEPRRGRGEPTAPDLGQSQRSRPISRLHPLVMHLDVHLPRLRKMSHARTCVLKRRESRFTPLSAGSSRRPTRAQKPVKYGLKSNTAPPSGRRRCATGQRGGGQRWWRTRRATINNHDVEARQATAAAMAAVAAALAAWKSQGSCRGWRSIRIQMWCRPSTRR